jgi:hypothetical protein
MPTNSERSSKRQLIEAYLRQRVETAESHVDEIPRNLTSSPAPLSFGQKVIWTHSQLEPGVPLYNEPWTVHFNGKLDVPSLERAINHFVGRHEAWRTVFPLEGAEPVQRVLATFRVPFQRTDLRTLPPGQKEHEATRIAELEARQLFDLEKGPLLRVHVITFDDDTHRLYLTLHHIIFDGFAIYRVFLPEVAQIYDAIRSDQQLSDGEAPIQYSHFARWQRRRWTDGHSERSLTNWRNELRDAPTALNLRTTYPRPELQDYAGGMCPVAIPGDLRNQVRDLGAQYGASLFMVLLAAFDVLLFRMSDQAEFLVGTVTAGRNHPELSSLVGYCLNTVVLRADLRGDPTFRALLERVRDNTLWALENDDFPFDSLLRELNLPRDPGRNPLYQVMFSLEPPIAPADPRWNITQIEVETGVAKLDLYFELDDRCDGVTGKLMYKKSLFSREDASGIVSNYIRLLEEIVAAPDLPISQLSSAGIEPGRTVNSIARTRDKFEDNDDPEMTAKVLPIWNSLLGRVTEDNDNFFRCGGYSLLALRLLREVENQFGVTVSYSELVQAPTPVRFARILQQKVAVKEQ